MVKQCDVMVAGSANMDLVFGCPRVPLPGETLLGSAFALMPGGKGANQAVAIGRLGGSVAFVGKVGADDNGARLRESLESSGVDVSRLATSGDAPTGVAGIFVGEDGENSIVVVPAANALVTAEEIQRAREQLQPRVVLAQLEIPLEAVSGCVGAPLFVLNPAPYLPLSDELLSKIDVITPNESETLALTGIEPSDNDRWREATRILLGKGVKTVMLTLGSRGCFVSDGQRDAHFPAPVVSAVDTTAAGDAFNGALALFLSQGMDVWEAAPLANRVAALSATKACAQGSMPTLAELDVYAK